MNEIDFFSLVISADGPVFRARPRSIEADNGASITLTCDVVGNPPPDILWSTNEKVSSDEKVFSKQVMYMLIGY